jgi:hypothetical protein
MLDGGEGKNETCHEQRSVLYPYSHYPSLTFRYHVGWTTFGMPPKISKAGLSPFPRQLWSSEGPRESPGGVGHRLKQDGHFIPTAMLR